MLKVITLDSELHLVLKVSRAPATCVIWLLRLLSITVMKTVTVVKVKHPSVPIELLVSKVVRVSTEPTTEQNFVKRPVAANRPGRRQTL